MGVLVGVRMKQHAVAILRKSQRRMMSNHGRRRVTLITPWEPIKEIKETWDKQIRPLRLPKEAMAHEVNVPLMHGNIYFCELKHVKHPLRPKPRRSARERIHMQGTPGEADLEARRSPESRHPPKWAAPTPPAESGGKGQRPHWGAVHPGMCPYLFHWRLSRLA